MKIEMSPIRIHIKSDPNSPLSHAIRMCGVNRVAKEAKVSGTYMSLFISGKMRMPASTALRVVVAVEKMTGASK